MCSDYEKGKIMLKIRIIKMPLDPSIITDFKLLSFNCKNDRISRQLVYSE